MVQMRRLRQATSSLVSCWGRLCLRFPVCSRLFCAVGLLGLRLWSCSSWRFPIPSSSLVQPSVSVGRCCQLGSACWSRPLSVFQAWDPPAQCVGSQQPKSWGRPMTMAGGVLYKRLNPKRRSVGILPWPRLVARHCVPRTPASRHSRFPSPSASPPYASLHTMTGNSSTSIRRIASVPRSS